MTNMSQQWLKKHYIKKYAAALQASPYTFEDRQHYALEIPCMNSYDILLKTIDTIAGDAIFSETRFCETVGSFLLSDQEITDMLELCGSSGYDMAFSLSPRPEYDIKASFYRSKFGLEQGRQVNNHEAFCYAVEDAYRLVDLGCRYIIVYDLGILKCLNDLKLAGDLPSDLFFKASSHCMVSNPIIAKIFYEYGANSVTTMHDCSIEVLNAMRLCVPKLQLDVPIDVYASKGGYVRFHELPDLVRYCSPITLKMGASLLAHPYDPNSVNVAPKRIERVRAGLEWLNKSLCHHDLKNMDEVCQVA